ncbi:CPBP family intramembrane glutamic endopeptidase [Dyella sp. EPa41]|uniref:CPBP family intramembrane glutamic endopeptidase n=1 Tax=Dyella sp. EPa41 TaxID=1561194 RepID=UPI00191647B4|nr:CPBP family intramembrane glutamic endopeptidase [Dyella sp. EPa41]
MSDTAAIRRFAGIVGLGLAMIAALWLMALLSAWITRARLVQDARQELAALREGQPLWQWRLRSPTDLVASRVFGSATVTHGAEALRITSHDGTPFELGLPLESPIDAAHWPRLELRLHSSVAGSLGLSYQAGESGPACVATNVAAIGSGQTRLSVDLSTVTWRTGTGATCSAPGVVAYMLRLRIQVPADTVLDIGEVALASSRPAGLPATIGADTADVRLPSPQGALSLPEGAAPLVRLPAGASAESMVALRDAIRAQRPAALVLPSGMALTGGRYVPPPRWWDGAVCGLYLLWLAALTWRQRPEVARPWVEAIAIAAGPLWLIAGLRWGPHVSIPGVIAFLAAIVFAAASEWRRRPVDWSWLGRSRADWWWPLLPLPVAFVLMLADGHGLIHLDPKHIAAYFGWALLQQWAMLAIVMGRLRLTALPTPVVIIVTAALFGLLHTPNGSLMQLCMLAELWWAWCFVRSPRLIPIAIAHATSALLVESGLTGHLLRSLEVSARFFL